MSIDNHGACPDCKTRLLPRMSTGSGKHYRRDESWCPKCHADWIARPPPPPTGIGAIVVDLKNHGPPQAPPVAVIGDEATGIRYQLRLQPDGLIQLRIGKLGPWLLSEEQARDFDGSLSAMALASRERRTHLRGADRWAFRREGETVYATIYDQEASLTTYTVGVQRAAHSQGFTCDRCKAALVKGARAYKPAKWRSAWRITWSEVRFCEACVTGVVEARAAKGLRVIDGGKGQTG